MKNKRSRHHRSTADGTVGSAVERGAFEKDRTIIPQAQRGRGPLGPEQSRDPVDLRERARIARAFLWDVPFTLRPSPQFAWQR